MFEHTIKHNSDDYSSGYTYKQEFNIRFSYDVHFTREVFKPENRLLASVMAAPETPASGIPPAASRVLVCIDSGVAACHPDLPEQVQAYFRRYAADIQPAAPPHIVPGGEQAKNDRQNVHRIMTALAACRLDRQSYVIAVGGGSVLDMVGFTAAVIHRGLRLIRIPSTVLAQNDAGVGVKNGINALGAKNFIGTFAPPYAVINDATLLTTLSTEDWRGGIAEAIKVALIKDRDFFEYICLQAEALKARNLHVMEELVRRCAVLHLEHIRTQGDPFEFGSSRPLDFGHWSAHKLEVMSRFRIGHGQAVAIGIALDSCYARMAGFITAADSRRILDCLLACGLPVWDPLLEKRDEEGNYEILKGLEEFREHLGGKLCITLPSPPGHKVEVHEMDIRRITDGIMSLKNGVK